jgi:nanoRNase/pAp phosphatase (c-di-AMP/oligoRNAs hydrolase)
MMLQLLTPEWEHSDILPNFEQYSAIALIDTQPGAGNNRFQGDPKLKVVIDHHNPIRDGLSQIPFVDINPEIGATATMVFQYLEAMDLTPDAELATAIFYGVRTDTRALSRDSSPADQYAYFKLLSLLDHKFLAQVEQAGLPREYFQAFSKGLLSAKVYERVIVAYQGAIHRPDFSAEMADLLIRHEDIAAVLCMGYHGKVLYLSMRTSSDDVDAGLLIQSLVTAPAKAGGHGKSAGGQVPLGGEPVETIAAGVEKRFLEVMREDENWVPLLV